MRYGLQVPTVRLKGQKSTVAAWLISLACRLCVFCFFLLPVLAVVGSSFVCVLRVGAQLRHWPFFPLCLARVFLSVSAPKPPHPTDKGAEEARLLDECNTSLKALEAHLAALLESRSRSFL